MRLNAYERKIQREIRAWEAEAPGWGTRLLAKPAGKAADLVQAVVPVSALRAALEGVDKLGRRLADARSILKRARAASLEELRARPLEECDRLALTIGRRAMALGGATGAAFGLAGAAGLVADVPSLLMLALRTIHRTGLCYGEKPGAEARPLPLGIFALASANSMEEKQAALAALRSGLVHERAWRDGIDQITERELAKEAATYSLKNLARSVSVNLGRRKAAETIPVIGAAVGGAVNAWYLRDVALTARRVFQDRRLQARAR